LKSGSCPCGIALLGTHWHEKGFDWGVIGRYHGLIFVLAPPIYVVAVYVVHDGGATIVESMSRNSRTSEEIRLVSYST